MAPQFGGVAYASVAAVFILSAYYNVLLAYCIYYIYGSFSTNLPWMQWEDDEVDDCGGPRGSERLLLDPINGS